MSGIGDATLFESHDTIQVQTTRLVKGCMLQLTYENENARTRKEQFLGLAKMAAGRL